MPETPGPAYRTIGDVSAIVGVPQHVLRFWEMHFPQIAPLKRGGNRRYYRPADVELLVRINRLLRDDGYTIKGVQKLLADGAAVAAKRKPVILPGSSNTASPGVESLPIQSSLAPVSSDFTPPDALSHHVPVAALIAIRDRLAAALAEARAA